jgi:hypothetical protein
MFSALSLGLAPANLGPRRALCQPRTISIARSVALASNNLLREINAAPNGSRANPQPIHKACAHAGSCVRLRDDECLLRLGRPRFGGCPR